MADPDLLARTVLVAPMHCDEEGSESIYPQNPGKSSSFAFQQVYWKSAVVLFATARRTMPNVQLAMVSNLAAPPPIGPKAGADIFRDLRAEYLPTPFISAPPAGFSESWGNTAFKFDAISRVCERYSDDTVAVFLDTDVVVLRSLAPMIESIASQGPFGLAIQEREDSDINGLTRLAYVELFRVLGVQFSGVPLHFGGEFLGARISDLRPMLQRMRELWALSLERHSRGEDHFRTEEHVWSAVFAEHPRAQAAPKEWIRRIWTDQYVYRDTVPTDEQLLLWHLPSEKQRGFARMFPAATDPGSWLFTASEERYRERVGELMGVPTLGRQKALQDEVQRWSRRFARALGRR